MTDKEANTYCGKCIKADVCGMEGVYDPATTYCAYRVEEQQQGEWIENTRYKRKGKRFLDCSVCHYGENGDIICEVSKVPSYCPNCGARMKLSHLLPFRKINERGDKNDL